MREMEIEVPVDMTIEATDTVNVPTPVPVDYDHNRLRNRDKPKQHPIHAIERLPETLAGKVDVEPNHSLMSDAEHTKLSGIQAGAQVNLIESVRVNGSPLTIKGKAVDVTVPTVYATDLQYDQTKGIIKLIGADGSVIGSIDTNLERVIKSGRYDTASQELVFITDDGSEIRVPVGDLVDTYTGDNTTITVADNVFSVAKAVLDQINAKADDSGVVHKAGAETIDGEKTFTDNMTLSRNGPIIFLNDPNIPRDGAPTDKTHAGAIFLTDASGTFRSQFTQGVTTDGESTCGVQLRNANDQRAYFTVKLSADGKAVATAPATPSGSNGNEIVTAGYLNSAPTVVHTTGNEKIGGQKEFSGSFSRVVTYNGSGVSAGNQYVTLASASGADDGMYGYLRFFRTKGKKDNKLQIEVHKIGDTSNSENAYIQLVAGEDLDDGTSLPPYASAPATPEGSTRGEIVTAGYANSHYVGVTGSQIVYGTKQFGNNPYIGGHADPVLYLTATTGPMEFSKWNRHGRIDFTGDLEVNGVVKKITVGEIIQNQDQYRSAMDMSVFRVNEKGERAVYSSMGPRIGTVDSVPYATASYRTSGQGNTDIVTFGMVPTLADIVHTTGNQYVAGTKTFTAPIRGLGEGTTYSTTNMLKGIDINVFSAWDSRIRIVDMNNHYIAGWGSEATSSTRVSFMNVIGLNNIQARFDVKITDTGIRYMTGPHRSTGQSDDDIVTYGMLKELGLIKG